MLVYSHFVSYYQQGLDVGSFEGMRFFHSLAAHMLLPLQEPDGCDASISQEYLLVGDQELYWVSWYE